MENIVDEFLTQLRNQNNKKSLIAYNNFTNINNSKYRSSRNGSISSISSCQSDSSDEMKMVSRRASAQDIDAITTENCDDQDYKRGRSMSDGNVIQPSKNIYNFNNNNNIYCDEVETLEVCPSLPDSVLIKLGFKNDDSQRERLSEEELERKFTCLSLAFESDSLTIKDRCARQRRYRDQTESNLLNEINRLIEKVNRMKPLCVDFETAELLSALLTQVDIVMKASILACSSSEHYGAVQLEDRLTEAVNVMVQHVKLLRHQRDVARRNFKRALEEPQGRNGVNVSSRKNNKEKELGKRRASIATIIQSKENHDLVKIEKRMARRTSEMSIRASSLNRNSRPNRLEMSLELNKIKEGMIDTCFRKESKSEKVIDLHPIPDESMTEHHPDLIKSSTKEDLKEFVNCTKFTLREKLVCRFRKYSEIINNKYKNSLEDRTLHDIFYFCAILCFVFSLVLMLNVVVEYEYARRGIDSKKSMFN